MDDNKFFFGSDGRIELVKFQAVLGLVNIIYLLCGTILQYCDTSNMVWEPEPFREGTYHRHSDIVDGIDKQIDKYTNWSNGCSLNNTLYTAAKFLYDLEKDIVQNNNQKALFLMRGECSYHGYPIHGDINKYAIEIIPDALECYAEYAKQQIPNFDWCEYNDKYKKLFNLNT